MVGLPYPNIYSPELKEKMTYLDATLGVRMYTCRFKPSGVPWAGRMAEGFLCKENDVPCKETPPPSAIKVKCPRYIFSHTFCGFVSFHFRWNFVQIYTTLYIEQLVISQINHFLFSFGVLLTQSKIYFCQWLQHFQIFPFLFQVLHRDFLKYSN